MDLLESIDSPVTKAISAVAGALFPNRATKKAITENQEIVTLSYRNSFPRLWNLQSTDGLIDWALAKPDLPRSLVIVWDGMPPKEGTINVADFVLPFDWAFAFSKTLITKVGAQYADLADSKPNDALPDLRILILDLSSEGHPGAFSYNSLPVLAHAAPWIQVYRPIQADRIELAALFSNSDAYTISLLRSAITQDSLGIEALLDDLRFPERIKSLRDAWIERDRSKDIEMLTSLYKANLLRAGTRHDVGNLLAPLALVEALPQSRRRPIKRAIMEGLPLRTALQNLATVVGLQDQSNASKSASSSAGIIKTMQDAGDLFGRRSFVKFLLVDDQFWLGYQHLVASFLFGDSYDISQGKGGSDDWQVVINGVGELRCLSSAEDILTILEALDPIRSWANPRLLDIGFDILALDLRLWIDSNGKTQFFERLLRVCSRLGTESIQDENFVRAFQSVENDGINDTEQGEIEALALFPLLLSHLDPSLPIVLFSSTHQRAVAEMISHRPNIIGEFAKPIFSGYGDSQNRSRPASMLERAITRAIELHESRKVWEELVARAKIVETKAARFEFADVTIRLPNKTKKPAEYLITNSSINGLAEEFYEYVSSGRFSDSLLAIGNWSEDVLGGKPEELPASATESAAAVAAVQNLRRIYPSYEEALQKVWNDPAYIEAVARVIRDLSSQISSKPARKALEDVLKQGRKNLPLNYKTGGLNALNLPKPLPQSAEGMLGRFLDNDIKAQTYLSANPDWINCLSKDTGSVTIAVTNGFRNARAHRHTRPADSSAIRELAIWCWLWTLAGIFPTSTTPLVERGDWVGLRPPLGITEFIHLKRPFVSSSITPGTKGAASLLPVLEQLKKVLDLGWLKINDAGLDSALDRLIV